MKTMYVKRKFQSSFVVLLASTNLACTQMIHNVSPIPPPPLDIDNIGDNIIMKKNTSEMRDYSLETCIEMAKKNNPPAIRELVRRYYLGTSKVSKDWNKALKWYAYGFYHQINFFDEDRNALSSMLNSMPEIEKKLSKGNNYERLLLAMILLDGVGMKKDSENAFAILQKMSTQGDPNAQYHLGVCYYKGDGCNKEIERAIYWWREAAKRGNEESKEILDQLNMN